MKPAEPDRMVRSSKLIIGNCRRRITRGKSPSIYESTARRWLYPSALSRICPVESLGGRAIATQERFFKPGNRFRILRV